MLYLWLLCLVCAINIHVNAANPAKNQKTSAATSAATAASASAASAPSLSSFAYTGAAVLPLFEKTHVLLGREARGTDKHTWNGFGGMRDTDKTTGKQEAHPVLTAAREFAEETEGLMMHKAQAKAHIDLDTGNTEYIIANNNKKTVTYITQFNDKIVNNFLTAFAHGKKHDEIDRVGYVEWQSLIETIANAPRDKNNKLKTPITIHAYVIHPKASGYEIKFEHIHLRPFFVSSLQTFAKDMLSGSASYTAGKNDKIRFYKW